MVYECLHCHVPQSAGAMVCPQCGTAFSGAVPADAELPAPGPPTPAAATLPNFTQAQRPDLAQGNAPPPPAWVMPTIPPMPPAEPYRNGRGNTRSWMIGAGIVGIILIGALLYWITNGSQNTDQTPVENTAAMAPLPPMTAPVSSGAPATIAVPGSPPSSSDSGALAAPVGHWMDKQYDYYDFDQDGTGSRGKIGGGTPTETFSYTVEHKQLNLSLPGNKSQRIAFSYGPGGNSLYLQQPGGRYERLERQGGNG
jgi:hypothetical protein